MAEIPNDVVNFFNNSQSPAIHYLSDDDDVGLLQLDLETTDADHLTSDGWLDSSNLFSCCSFTISGLYIEIKSVLLLAMIYTVGRAMEGIPPLKKPSSITPKESPFEQIQIAD